MKELLKKQLENKSFTMPILSFPSVQLLGISVKELVTSSDLQAAGMKKIADRCCTSASVSMMDLSVEAEAFGANVNFNLSEVPTVTGTLLKTENDIDELRVPQVGEKRTSIYIDAIKKAKKLIFDRPIYAGVIGPFSLAGRLMDMTEIMINCYDEPEMVHKTLKKGTQFILEYIIALKEAGADGIVMAEPAAGLLSPDMNEEFSASYVKEIVKTVSDNNFIFIYHNCGNVVPLSQSIIDINADIYHFGNAIDIEQMVKIMPKDKLIMGNINPVLFRDAKSSVIEKEVMNLLNRCHKYENFVISTGCDMPPDSKWENIDKYFQTVQKFYEGKE